MPRRSKKTSRKQRAPAPARKPKKARKQPRSESALRRYIRSVLIDQVMSGVDLPCGDFTGRYTTVTTNARLTLTAGAGVEATCAVNPYALWTDKIYIARLTGGAEQWQFVPSIVTNGTATAAGSFPSNGAAGYVSLMPQQAFGSSVSIGYSAWVRPKFVHFRLIYTGTELNKGGQVQFVHNPDHVSLLSYADISGSDIACFNPSITTVAALTSQTENVSSHHIGDGLDFTWRPRHYNFVPISSRYGFPAGTGSLATANQQNTGLLALGLLPDPDTPLQTCPIGWVAGFRLQPAAGTASTALPYELEITAEYDFVLHRMDSASATTTLVMPGNKVPISNPVAEAHLRNATSALHAHRSARAVPHNATSLGLTSKAAESFMAGMAESAGQAVLSRLAGAAA